MYVDPGKLEEERIMETLYARKSKPKAPSSKWKEESTTLTSMVMN